MLLDYASETGNDRIHLASKNRGNSDEYG